MRTAICCLCLTLASTSVFAQSATDKARATGNDVKRGVNKAVDRTKEALCTGTKLECETRKAKNHLTETKDEVVDKVKEEKDKLVK